MLSLFAVALDEEEEEEAFLDLSFESLDSLYLESALDFLMVVGLVVDGLGFSEGGLG